MPSSHSSTQAPKAHVVHTSGPRDAGGLTLFCAANSVPRDTRRAPPGLAAPQLSLVARSDSARGARLASAVGCNMSHGTSTVEPSPNSMSTSMSTVLSARGSSQYQRLGASNRSLSLARAYTSVALSRRPTRVARDRGDPAREIRAGSTRAGLPLADVVVLGRQFRRWHRLGGRAAADRIGNAKRVSGRSGCVPAAAPVVAAGFAGGSDCRPR